MAAPKVQAAVFDLDGMILDTRNFLLETYGYALSTYGYPRPAASDFYPFVGQHISVGLKALAPKTDVDLVLATYREFHDKNQHLIVAYEGLPEMLKQLKQAGIKMGVFTARGPGANQILKKFKVLKYFDAVVTSADVTKHKPHPEGLLKTLGFLKTKPQGAAMLGDAKYDIQAGKKTKVKLTIGITHGFGTREELAKAKPDYIVDSLAEIPPILIGKMGSNDPD